MGNFPVFLILIRTGSKGQFGAPGAPTLARLLKAGAEGFGAGTVEGVTAGIADRGAAGTMLGTGAEGIAGCGPAIEVTLD